jgi:hypothetical protein
VHNRGVVPIERDQDAPEPHRPRTRVGEKVQPADQVAKFRPRGRGGQACDPQVAAERERPVAEYDGCR